MLNNGYIFDPPYTYSMQYICKVISNLADSSDNF